MPSVALQGPPDAPTPPPTLSFNFSNTLSDHAVLRRQGASVFGFGPVFAHFTVTLADATVQAVVQGIVASDGTWRVSLPPQPAGGPYVVFGNLSSSDPWVPANSTLSWVLNDILFGDVFVCGKHACVCEVCVCLC